MYTIKRTYNKQTDEITLETARGVRDYLMTELCRDDMFVVVDWPVRFGDAYITATDFKAPGESCVNFAAQFIG